MKGVITALIIALSFILVFFWAPIVGVVFGGNLDSAQSLRMSDNSVNAGYITGYAADLDKIGATQISISHPDAQKMGAVSFRISRNSYRAFFKNDMILDIDKITVNCSQPVWVGNSFTKNRSPANKARLDRYEEKRYFTY